MLTDKHMKLMVGIKFFWMAVVILPLLTLLVYLLYGWLDHDRSGHRSSKLSVSIAKNMENGISTPAYTFLVEQLAQSALHSASNGLKEFVLKEAEKYSAVYAFRTTQEGFYLASGALQDSLRLDDLLRDQATALALLSNEPSAVHKRQELLDAQNVARVQRRYFNPKNLCSIALINATRYANIGSHERVAMHLELTPVSNEAGTLLKLKVWRLALNYSECVVPRWKSGVSLSVRVVLAAVVQDSSGVSDQILLDDVIEFPNVELGVQIEHDALKHLETKWFAMPPRLSSTLGTLDGSDAVTEQHDLGNYTVHIQVMEQALP